MISTHDRNMVVIHPLHHTRYIIVNIHMIGPGKCKALTVQAGPFLIGGPEIMFTSSFSGSSPANGTVTEALHSCYRSNTGSSQNRYRMLHNRYRIVTESLHKHCIIIVSGSSSANAVASFNMNVAVRHHSLKVPATAES